MQASVPPLGLVPMASVIDAELPVTVFPFASSTVTTGCVPQAVPPVPPPGCVVNTTFVAVPGVNVTVAVCVTVMLSVVSVAV